MKDILKFISCFKSRFEEEETSEEKKIADALREWKRDSETLESLFNCTSDSDMIDYYAHEYKALNARYSYIIKRARTNGITFSPRPKGTVLR